MSSARQGKVQWYAHGGETYLYKIKAADYLEGIYNTVIVKDIEERQNRKGDAQSGRRVTDAVLLKNIAKYLAGSVGSLISVNGIANYINSNERRVSPNTVIEYTQALSAAFIFYTVDRYDISGKQLLKSNRKWYIVDLGLRNHILPKSQYDLGFSAENTVYLELLRRGYGVHVGKCGNAEIDFVAQKQGVLSYYQVSASLTDENTFKREINPLRSVRDNYEKIILTLDRFTPGDYDGIKVVNIVDWLLGE